MPVAVAALHSQAARQQAGCARLKIFQTRHLRKHLLCFLGAQDFNSLGMWIRFDNEHVRSPSHGGVSSVQMRQRICAIRPLIKRNVRFFVGFNFYWFAWLMNGIAGEYLIVVNRMNIAEVDRHISRGWCPSSPPCSGNSFMVLSFEPLVNDQDLLLRGSWLCELSSKWDLSSRWDTKPVYTDYAG